jgi:DNA-binding NarL/FixJ family response regulator
MGIAFRAPAVDGLHMGCRVLIADDVAALRVLWRQFLTDDPDIDVVGEAADGADAIAQARELQPDILLVDLSMPRVDGLEVIRTLHPELPEMKIVVASGFAASRLAPVALELGASAYFEKGGPAARLLEIVKEVCVVA